MHLIGDIHQPLHVGKSEDAGGHKINLKWFDKNTNLHKVWDENLIEFQKLSYTEYTAFIDHINSADAKKWEKSSIIDWVNEGMQEREKIYAGLKDENGKKTYNLGHKYNFDNIEVLNNRLRRAGVRLAAFLNNIFDNRKNIDSDKIREKLGAEPGYGLKGGQGD
ncbi:MAG: S1/P1 nuclease [Proteobacteria bacterium]|nr:S1/P1 nuclease [Pseudomonadota bacterium]